MRAGKSILAQLVACIAIFVVLVLSLAVTTVVAVTEVGRNAAVINGEWLAGTRILGELEGEVFAFRLAEADRALADAAHPTALSETEATLHRTAVEGAVRDYLAVIGADQPQANVSVFAEAWGDYLIMHDAWVRADTYRHASGIARERSSLDWRYKAVARALDALKAANYQAAAAQAAKASDLALMTKGVVGASSLGAVLLAVGLFSQIRTNITAPLASITAALSRLAAGGRLDARMPEMDRDDEVGDMARAFDTFRTGAAELEDAHAETRAAQQQASLLARHDALTGLPNRRVFAAELDAALARARDGTAACAVMLIDLDRFKPVNDVRGHAAGDRVLCEVARRLEAVEGGRKSVARLGGDEFAVILEGPDAVSLDVLAAAVARGVLDAVREPIAVGDAVVSIGASIGIARGPWDGTDADAVLRASDLAMYRAKQDGRDTFRFFEPRMDSERREQARLDEDLRTTVRAGRIVPHYQPLVSLVSGKLRGFEVLSRWTHPEHGAVPPDRFIGMAERLGLMPDLTASVLRQACRDARHWGDDVRLAVNVSPSQLADRQFPLRTLAILSEERFAPARLEIEITESALVGDVALAREIIATLQSLGITVALDDFGTGYSSLSHLRHMRFDTLKIDRSFVQSVTTDGESAKIVDAVLSLADSMGMTVVAEGIEDEAALRYLTARGCAYGQGFFFGRPVSAQRAAAIVSVGSLRLSA